MNSLIKDICFQKRYFIQFYNTYYNYRKKINFIQNTYIYNYLNIRRDERRNKCLSNSC
jgi:hypothetical protein